MLEYLNKAHLLTLLLGAGPAFIYSPGSSVVCLPSVPLTDLNAV